LSNGAKLRCTIRQAKGRLRTLRNCRQLGSRPHYNYHAPNRTVPDDFGVLLSSQNIEAHLARIRSDREHYRKTHPEDIAEIDTLAREVAKTKHCSSTTIAN
jgi:hypothetical protein